MIVGNDTMMLVPVNVGKTVTLVGLQRIEELPSGAHFYGTTSRSAHLRLTEFPEVPAYNPFLPDEKHGLPPAISKRIETVLAEAIIGDRCSADINGF